MIGTQNSIIKPEKAFEFHPDFVDWKGAVYTEETVDGKRHYTINGVRYPSITTVLSYDPDKIRTLARWRKRVGNEEANKISRHSTTRGKSLHKLCENYVTKNETEIKTFQERENFFKLKPELDRSLGKIYCVETALFSHELEVAGRTDLIAEWDGIPAVIDVKGSGKTKYRKNIDGYFIQGCAYALMFHEMTGIYIPKVVILMATEELPKPQVFIEETEKWIQPLKSAIATYKDRIHYAQKNNNSSITVSGSSSKP